MHGYDHNAIDASGQIFYHRPFQWPIVYRYNIKTKNWTSLPKIPGFDQWSNCCGGLEYFPEMGGLVLVVNGGVYFFDESRQRWSTLANNLAMGVMHNFAEYNPIHRVILFGGGNNDNPDGGSNGRRIYKLDSEGKITSLNSAPESLGVLSSVQAVDPVTGKFLFLTNKNGSGLQFYAYNITTDNWNVISGSVPVRVYDTVTSALSDFGVVMFTTWINGAGKVYLYKFAADDPPPAAPTNLRVIEIIE
jgi:hypothetical protein